MSSRTAAGERSAKSKRGGRTSNAILFVDDEELVRKLAKATLERSGFEVFLASDGRDALAALEQNRRIGLIVLDLSMPVLRGDKAAALIRARWPDVRIVMTSGYTESEAHRLFQGKGMDGFLEKPFTPRQLAEKVRSILGEVQGPAAVVA